MADSLQKKKLKTLQLTDWASFIEDVNYNFSVLLSSPLFVGTEGEAGADGKQGSPGIRGSKWLFVNLTSFQEQFPEDNIKGEYQITVDYLNKKLLTETTKAKLLKATNAGTMFVDGDVLVSNSRVLLLDLTQNKFLDTGESISSNSELFLQNIEKQVIKLVNDTLENDPVYMGLTQTVDLTEAQAKNYVDGSGNLNNQVNENSMLDVKSTTSKPGAVVDTHKMFTPAAKMYDDDDNLTWIFGSAENYHQLIQKTLAYNAKDTSSNTVGSYGPTLKNPPALVVLQNTQSAGMMIGFKGATKFTDFARMYVNKDGAYCITSPNISDHYLKFSQIMMYNNLIDVIADYLSIKCETNFSGHVNILNEFDFTHRWLTIRATGEVGIGSSLMPTKVNAKNVIFTEYPETDFLSIDKNHRLSANSYSVDKAETLETLSKRSDRVITSNQLWMLYEYAKSTQNSLEAFRTSITNQLASAIERLDKTDASLQTQITNIRGGYTGSMQDIVNLISSEIAKLDISGIAGNLAAEITARKNADANLQSQINSLKGSGSETNLSDLLAKLNKEIADRKDGDTSVTNAMTSLVNDEKTKRESGDNAIRGGYEGSMKTLYDLISQTGSSSSGNYTSLLAKLNQEITDRKSGDSTLDESLKTETSARTSGDTAIRGGYSGSMQDLLTLINSVSGGASGDVSSLTAKINQEITDRKTSDNDIITKLNKEISDRGSADTAIRGGYSGSMQDLVNIINALTGGSEVDLSGIVSKINQEITDRTNADASIRGGYSNSMQDLYNAIGSQVSSEAVTRKNADDALSKRIDGIVAASPTVEGNTVFRPGMIVDLYVTDSGSYSSVRNKLFNSNGQGKTSASYSTPLGSVSGVDLSRFWICDGSSGTPDLRNCVTAGASDLHGIGSKVGQESLLIGTNQIPKHTHSITARSVTTNEVSHYHSVNLSTNYAGAHTHSMRYGNWKWGDNASRRDFINPSGTSFWPTVCNSAGNHTHTVSGNTGSHSHSHTFNIPAVSTAEQYTGSQASISVMQPTVYCFKVMFK